MTKMPEKQLYRVECWHSYKCVDFFCLSNCHDALDQAGEQEDPELGGVMYGEPSTAIPCTYKEMDRYARMSARFPEGAWAATDEAMDALEHWRKENTPCPLTLSMF